MPVSLIQTQKLVWPIIKEYLKDPIYPKRFRIPSKFSKDVAYYWKINREYPKRRGKYLRPTLVLLTAMAFGKNNKEVLRIAAAMQLSEDWILIHDDIEDSSKIRRGEASLHMIYGHELAINAGDALHAIMWKMISDIKSEEVSNEFYKILMRTILGQGVEQIWTNKKTKDITKDEYFFIADSKSGFYSITGPMRLGAVASGATKYQIEKITDFGLHLGRCFQLVDDILDVRQDKKDGKVTLATSKGVEVARKLAEEEKAKAKKIFETKLTFLSKEPARRRLAELIEFILNRTN